MFPTQTRRSLFALLLILGLVLSACGGSPVATESTTAPTDAPAAEPTTATSGSAATAEATTETEANGEMRKLTGTIRLALAGAVQVEGAPETLNQKAWRETLAKYKELQPGVEIEIEDLPPGQTVDDWCPAKLAANQLPDFIYIEDCNHWSPTPEQIASGEALPTDWAPFENEISPYTGKPWKEDWVNDYYRAGRCRQNGALTTWTCQLDTITSWAVWVNTDILQEYGYTELPTSYREVWELSDKINTDGKYQAWDSAAATQLNTFFHIMLTSLAMDRVEAAGFDYKDPLLLGKQNNLVWATNLCNGNFTASNNPSIKEAILQAQRFGDKQMPGGAAAYYDPARDPNGQQWLAGKAALRLGDAGFYSRVLQAEQDGALSVKNWQLARLPKLTTEDLFNKELPIYWDGEPFMKGTGSGDWWAPLPKVRHSGEDPNIDLIVRDFIQFLSSPTGQERVLTTGRVPANPALHDRIPEGLAVVPQLHPEIFFGWAQPPSLPVWAGFYVDPQQSLQAWLSGNLGDESALQTVDETIRAEQVKEVAANLEQYELTELPEACKPYAQ